ncbi:MAG: GTP 3',8-cyclase MoaA [Clostridia bacterium]|nr:GTP 3',8-cyclase MoaA [Clostridia bacterium]
MIDRLGRQIDYLRVSITDRCNLRCIYCMPEHGVQSLEHSKILTFEEIEQLVRLGADLGIRHIRITGGEPTARKNWLSLVERIHAIPKIETISMTTNALLLDGMVGDIKAAGVNALNISIDSLNPDTYAALTRGGDVMKVRRVIDDALALGIRVKLNAVPIRGYNEKELVQLAQLAKDNPVYVRFIELMPVGCGANLSPIPSDEILQLMQSAFGPLTQDSEQHGFGPAVYVKPQGFSGSIGVISAMSHEFCDRCNRVRLTAEGFLKLCLNHAAGLDLRTMLRSGASEDDIRTAMADAINRKPQRHGFLEEIDDRDKRRMNEIGG